MASLKGGSLSPLPSLTLIFLSFSLGRLNIIPLTGEGGSLLFVICHLLANCSCLKHSLRNLFGILNIFLKDGSFRTMEFTLFLQIYV